MILNQSTEWCPIFRNQVLEICAGWSNQITDRSTPLKDMVTKARGMGTELEVELWLFYVKEGTRIIANTFACI